MVKQVAAQQAKTNVVATAGKGGVLQRQCSCGNHTIAGGECVECKKSKQKIFRKANHHHSTSTNFRLPGSSGQPLEKPLQQFMELRFKHDFSRVRLHTDQEAAASARSIGALAYTIGQDIVFDSSSYQPTTPQGLHLLAHELAHVVQQDRHPLAKTEELHVEPETSPAEVEADRTALAVVTPGPVQVKPSARSTGVNRGIGWAFLGALAGALVGLLGFLAGPAVGVALLIGGAALGAWIAGSLTNDQTKDKSGPPLQRIHRLLTRTGIDWVITDEEALQALAILQDVEKRDPEQLFDIAMAMKLSGDWQTLRKELPRKMQPSFDYFDLVPLNPDHGLIMPGDTIHLEFYFPGQGRRSRETREKERKEAEDKKQPFKESFEEFISTDYTVGSDGIHVPKMDKPIAVVGKSLKEAADLAAKGFTDPLWAYQMAVDLTPVKRGIKYAGMGDVISPETVSGSSTTQDTNALARRDKRRKFTDLVPFSLASAGGRTELAVLLYYREVDEHLDQHDDPQTLWSWARQEADKRYEDLNKKTPRQEFLSFAQLMMSHVSTLPKDEQRRYYETWSRYLNWLSQASDERLTKNSPVEIWTQAYMNIFRAEVEKSSQKALDDLREKRRQEAFKQGEEKLQKTIDFAVANIWPVQPTRGITIKEEQLSETTGSPVQVGYLIQASTAEKLIRDKIASDFLHSQIEHLMKDPEAFNNTTVKADLVDYLNKNPDQLKALQLTASHPDVERQEYPIDIPAWQIATEVIVGFIPFVGSGVAIVEVVGGRDMFGHPLTTTERVILGVAILLPSIAKVFKVGKGAVTAARIAKDYSLADAEAARVYKIYMGLKPGSTGAKLFDWGAREIKAGRAIDDPAVIKQMETVLKDLGMTEKETAKALLPAVERQAEEVALEEIQALKTMTGAISDDTEKMLLKNGPLREALKENNLAARILKKCNTPCWPEEATAEQIRRLEGLFERLQKANALDEEALRRFLYARRSELDTAIDEIAARVTATESSQAKTIAGAAKAAPKETRVLDVADRVKAAEKLQRLETEIAETRVKSEAARTASAGAKRKMVALLEQPKEIPASLKKEMERLNKLDSLEDKIEGLKKWAAGKRLSTAETEYVKWRTEAWSLRHEAEQGAETARDMGKKLNNLFPQREVAAEELREASKDVMDVLRTEGPKYRGKSSVTLDEVMSKKNWDALAAKPPLATDHLVALDRISKLQELNELLVLYPKGSAAIKEEIKAELKALGDMPDNLVRMRADVNSGIKSNKSWHEITYSQVEKYYSVAEVDAIRAKEDKSLGQILDKIKELTDTFKAKIQGQAATKAAGAGAGVK